MNKREAAFVIFYVFLAPALDNLENFPVFEGKKVAKLPLPQAVKSNFPHIEDNLVLEELKTITT